MWLNTKTENSFGAVYGRIDDIVKKLATMANYAGIADLGNTFGHVEWSKACKKYGIKPIFGVQLPVVENLEKVKETRARFPHNWMTFIAKNNEGLAELYKLVDTAHQQFYYIPRLSYEQVNEKSLNVLLLGENVFMERLPNQTVHSIVTPATPAFRRDVEYSIPSIDNYYINIGDKVVYEPFADERKRERKTTLMHIPTKKEWCLEFSKQVSFCQLKHIAELCTVTLPSAPMVKYEGHESLDALCSIGARKRKLGTHGYYGLEGSYLKRYDRELKVIKEKNFQDYFLVVADLVKYAKTKMCVGPARGSAAGSLICYLLGITEVDPIKYDLYFERFIDLNRSDLPDIDIDFQDDKRHLVVKYLEKKYGADNVAQIANINRLKPKSAITRFAKAFHLPLDDVEEIKNIVPKNTKNGIKEIFENSDLGKEFLKKYPNMAVAAKVEGHASHAGVHAAGVLVCSKPVTNYCGVNSRDNKRIAMIDKKDAETLNLLKIDALGLRTLSIIAGVCDSIGKPYSWIYELPTDDKDAFKVFNQHRFSGIFQFEGDSVKTLAKAMPIEDIEDISALSALGRPGPLASGAAWDYVNARAGREPAKWISEHPLIKEATKETYGVIVYQEQVMRIVREVALFSWADTGAVRKAIAKSKTEDLNVFRQNFYIGIWDKGIKESKEAISLWEQIETFGGYAFNKSHSISYGLISYYCAYLKAHYPLEFTVACLNNSKDDNSALRILRDAVENDGVEYKYIDWSLSIQNWSVSDKTLLGGFTSIHGVGSAGANKIIKLRNEGKPYPPGIQKHLDNDISPFKYLYPAKEVYGDYYTDHQKFDINSSVVTIDEVKGVESGFFNIIGKLIENTPRGLNEPEFVAKRNGEYLKGQTSYLIFKLEDDTDEIRCKITAKNYFKLGQSIAETGKVDKDWYVVCGKKIHGWNILFVENIRKITR